MHVEPWRNTGVVRVSSHHPLRAVVHIPERGGQQRPVSRWEEGTSGELLNGFTPVAFGVHGHHVHGDVVLLARLQIAHFDAHGWEHSPDGSQEKNYAHIYQIRLLKCFTCETLKP